MEGKGTVLLIEDSARYQRMYGSLLKAEQYSLLRAMDGEMGLLLAKKKKPDLIVMELLLPKKHGVDVIRELRLDKETKEIPIIVFSVSGKEEDMQSALKTGANDYLVKGYQSPRDIVDKIRLFIGKKASEIDTNVYQVMVYERKGDAARMQRDMGLPVLFRCPDCKEELVFEMVPEEAKKGSNEHSFKTTVLCPSCKKKF
jgi:DNA-binding response OmpR family regulator